MKSLKYSTQSIAKNDVISVSKVLKSEYLTQGPKTEEFEKKIKNLVESKYALASNSGSSALLLACKALSLKPKDLFWTVPNSFVATANCGVLTGLKVDFIDIDPDTWNISLLKLEEKLKKAKKKRKLPKLIIVVHLGGLPVNPIKLKQLSKTYKFKIIEDASHSFGAKYFSKRVGCSKWSDITVFSFHPVKIITTGEGGCCTTNNKKYHDKMKALRFNGIIKEKKNFKYSNLGPWYYEQHFLGYNFKMNEIQSTLGISQLKKLKKFLIKRNKVAQFYIDNLSDLPIKFQKIEKNFYSSYHLFIIKLNTEHKNLYKIFFNYLRAKNIFVNLHYLPIHLQPFYRKFGFKRKQFPISEEYSETAISIPIYPDLKKTEQIKIINLIKLFFKKNA
jgi:UDP-4-amino-4,6-dideoxy-N-acetyl-beta-L-altrosamine transaminase|tara:strand:+ start:37 stop:1206 length:1170 start_codon:yes stop_codon:yes gene_type:complete